MLINFNGNILTDDQPIFTAGNRAFRYGDGLFESIRVFDGRMPFLGQHWQRLSAGMAYLKMHVPDFFSSDFFENEIQKLTDGTGNWRIRLTVWRTGGGLYTPETNDTEFLIEATKLTDSVFALNHVGLKIGIFDQQLLPVQTPQTNQTPHTFKTASALPFVLAAICKKEASLDDIILFNTAGRLACGGSSNLFLVKNGQLHTPPLSEGCVAGTMRGTVLRLAQQLGIEVFERPIELEFLPEADELFLTNAIQGIRWVSKVEGMEKSFVKSLSGQLVEALNHAIYC